MLTFAVILNLLTAAGILAMAAKYMRVVAPMDYHAQMLSAAPISDAMKQILHAQYRCMGAGFGALGLLVIVLTLHGVRQDLLWAKLSIIVAAGAVAFIVAKAGRDTEIATGVQTPWRIAAGLGGLAGLGFIVSLL